MIDIPELDGQTSEQADEATETVESALLAADLVEEVSIDGMCGVY